MNSIVFLPEGKSIPVELNKTILDICLENDVLIGHKCGGVASCTSCTIVIKKGEQYFNQISEEEKFQISGSIYNLKESRLACSTYLIEFPEENVEIEIPCFVEEKDL